MGMEKVGRGDRKMEKRRTTVKEGQRLRLGGHEEVLGV